MSMRFWPVVLLGSSIIAGVGSTSGCRRGDSEVVVSAASSLAVQIGEIARQYSEAGGDRIVLNTGASSSLARQIVEGAPVDVFISADEAQMAAVERAGRVMPGSRIELLSNQLALVVPSGSAPVIDNLDDLTAPTVRRIGLGDPAGVPVGVYARELLTTRGMWERVQPKIIPLATAEMTLSTVEAGHVDAAFVFLSDARRSSRVRTVLVIGRAEGPRIVYPAAIVSGGHNLQGGRRFLQHLREAEARAVFMRDGFVLP